MWKIKMSNASIIILIKTLTKLQFFENIMHNWTMNNISNMNNMSNISSTW